MAIFTTDPNLKTFFIINVSLRSNQAGMRVDNSCHSCTCIALGLRYAIPDFGAT